MKKILITLSVIISGFYLASAISLDLSGGDILYRDTWNNIGNITSKINLYSNNLNISGKLISTGRMCIGNSCLGECNTGYHWDANTNTCISNTKQIACSGSIVSNAVSNGSTTFTQTWDKTSKTYLPASKLYSHNTTAGECEFVCDTSSSEVTQRYYWNGNSCQLLEGTSNFKLTSSTSTSLSFSRTLDPLAQIHWIRNSTDTTSRVNRGMENNYTFTDLIPGKEYTILSWSGINNYPTTGINIRGELKVLKVRTDCETGKVWDNDTNSCIILATTPETAALSCKDLYDNYNIRTDGIYYIKPTGYTGNAFEVYCDMTTDGGGWTLMSAYKAAPGAANRKAPVKVANGTLNYDPFINGVTGTNRFIDTSTVDANTVRYDCQSIGKHRIVQIGTGTIAINIKNNPLGMRGGSFIPGNYGENHTGATPTAAGGYGNNIGFVQPFGGYAPDWGIRFDGNASDSCATGGEGRAPYDLGGIWTIRIK